MKKKIAWVVPFPIKGSGGHRTIFQNVARLQEHGAECVVYLQDLFFTHSLKTIQKAKEQIQEYYGVAVNFDIVLGWELQGVYDVIFATGWETAKVVRDYPHARKYAYFIQDFEAYFHPMGDGYLLAENTYKYKLAPITIGRWLAHKMSTDYGMPARFFHFCADLSVYKQEETPKEKNAVCMIYQPEKPRRGPVVGLEALGIVKHMEPSAQIYLYGSEESTNVWFDHTNLGIISPQKCADLYITCEVGLCISSSNPSRIPFEMMACGLPVVDIYRENNLYDMPSSAILLADQSPESIAEAILTLLKDQKRRREMSQAGTIYMKDKDLEVGFTEFIQAVEDIIEEKDSTINTNEELEYGNPKFTARIIQIQKPHMQYAPTRVQRIKRLIYLLLVKFAQWLKR